MWPEAWARTADTDDVSSLTAAGWRPPVEQLQFSWAHGRHCCKHLLNAETRGRGMGGHLSAAELRVPLLRVNLHGFKTINILHGATRSTATAAEESNL